MRTVQEQLDDDLTKLLMQFIVNAEKIYFLDNMEKEQILFSWQTTQANYKLTRQLAPTNKTVQSLSSRERQIIQLIMQGTSNRGIAQTLGISPNTVSTYIRRVFVKLGVCTRAEMVSCVLRDNLLQSA